MRELPVLHENGGGGGAEERLRRELAGGLLYCHHRANTNTSKALEVSSFAYALIELLIEKGLLTADELDERKREVGERLLKNYNGHGMHVAIQESAVDKYEFRDGPVIDCESRLELCRAACCRLKFPLSRQDLEEGVVKWDLSRPYLIARHPGGYCIHLSEGGGCGVYENRPLPCRAYDCRGDERIWSDFENRVVSPGLEQLMQETSAA
jgi:Fe-S-cluster containining protein